MESILKSGQFSLSNQPEFVPSRIELFQPKQIPLKDEILRQKTGFYEQEIWLAEQATKIGEFKQINQNLLNEIER